MLLQIEDVWDHPPRYTSHSKYLSFFICFRFESIPCKFHSEGCIAMLQRKEKEAHEEKCLYGIPCKIYLKANETVKIECCWRGRKERLYDHITTNHEKLLWAPQSLQSNDTFTWMLALNINMEKVSLNKLEKQLTVFNCRLNSSGLRMLGKCSTFA